MRLPGLPAPRTAGASALSLAIVALGAAELAIPSLAEKRLREHAAAIAPVESVDVRARPAIKALWGDVDAVDVRLGSGEIDPARLHEDGVLERLRGVDEVRASARSLSAGPLAAEDVRLAKDGDRLTARFGVELSRLRAALPGAKLRAEGSSDGVTIGIRMAQLPIPGGLRMHVGVKDGALVAEPQGAAAAMIGTRRLLATDAIELDALSSRVEGDRLALELRARV